MASKEVQKIEEEIIPVLKNLDVAARQTFDRWTIGDRRLTNSGEIDPIMMKYNEIMQIHNNIVAETHKTFQANPPTEKQAKEYKEKITLTIEALHSLHHRLDNSEQDFLKYDVPMRKSFQSSEACDKALKAFMRIWREETEKGRDKGEKCLVEWLQKLHQSHDDETKETFEELRNVAVHLGTHISYPLASYCMFMAVIADSWKELGAEIQNIYAVIESLQVDKNSAIIDKFLDAVVYVYKALDESWRGIIASKTKEDKEKKGVEQRALMVANDLLHLILREVLRLEVAYFCPDLPMLVTNEVFVGMARHLMEVFQKRLNNVTIVENELVREMQQARRDEDLEKYKFTKRMLKEGLEMVWEKLELKPTEGERPNFTDR